MMIGDMKQQARLYAGNSPPFFFGYHRARRRRGDLLVNRKSEVVIEGFPRSGNTFAVSAFEYAQRRDVRIAHHLHAPAQVARAVSWGIPTLVLVREPVGAVLSLMLRDQWYSARRALRYYISFHETVARYRDGFVLGRFEEVVQDYGTVMERLNARFDTRFEPFEHTPENVEKVFARIEESHRKRRGDKVMEEQIARPSAARVGLKEDLMGELFSPELAPVTVRAQATYQALIS